MLFIIVGGVIVGAVGIAAAYDYRARRRGANVSVSAEEALDNRIHVEPIHNPSRDLP